MTTASPMFVVASTSDTPTTLTTRYISLASSPAQAQFVSTQSLAVTPIAATGTISNFSAHVSGAITVGSYTVTLQTASTTTPADTSCVVVLDSSNQSATDSTHTASVTQGDYGCIKVSTVAITGGGTLTFSYLFTSSATGETYLCWGHGSSGAAIFVPLGAYVTGVGTETVGVQTVMPSAGTINAVYAYASTAPGAGTSRTYTVRKNGSDTAIAAQISDTSTTANGSGTVTFVAGDLINIGVTIGGSPAASVGHGCIRITMTTDGESILPNTWTGTLSSSNTVFGSITGRTSPTESTESNCNGYAPVAFTWKNLYVAMTVAPGASKTRTVTARLGGADQTLTVPVTGAATTTGSDTTHTVSVSAGNLINYTEVPTSTPASANVSVASLAYIAPPTPPSGVSTLTLLGAG